MSGALGVLSAHSALGFTIGVADPGGGVFGAQPGSGYGTITPGTLKGFEFRALISVGSVNLRFTIGTTLFGTNSFRYLAIQNSAGSIQILQASAATLNIGADFVSFDWTGGSNVWTTSHASRSVTFYF